MNAPHDRMPGDRELERLLADDGGELGALYRRLPRPEPPRRLDRAVFGAAARAAHGHTPRRQRWIVGLGSAAGIVLAAGVAWHVGQDALQREQAASAPTAIAPVGRVRPTVVPVEPITPPAARPREPAEATPAETATAETAGTQTAPARQGTPRQETAQPSPAAKANARRKEAAAPPPPPPPPALEPAPAPAPLPQAFAPAEVDAESAPAEAAGRGAPAAASDAAPRSTSMARPRSATAPSPSSSVELRRDLQLDPDTWLARIEELLRKGRRQQAIESLRLFRVAHPDRELPDHLRALL